MWNLGGITLEFRINVARSGVTGDTVCLATADNPPMLAVHTAHLPTNSSAQSLAVSWFIHELTLLFFPSQLELFRDTHPVYHTSHFSTISIVSIELVIVCLTLLKTVSLPPSTKVFAHVGLLYSDKVIHGDLAD
jgi:hypothetical protein